MPSAIDDSSMTDSNDAASNTLIPASSKHALSATYTRSAPTRSMWNGMIDSASFALGLATGVMGAALFLSDLGSPIEVSDGDGEGTVNQGSLHSGPSSSASSKLMYVGLGMAALTAGATIIDKLGELVGVGQQNCIQLGNIDWRLGQVLEAMSTKAEPTGTAISTLAEDVEGGQMVGKSATEGVVLAVEEQ